MENPEESIEVTRSEDGGGNGLPTDITPSEEPQEPVAPTVNEQPTETPEEASQPSLYKLPDGREVDPDTLYKEYTENLLPEFTRKSQELAKLKGGEQPIEAPQTEIPQFETYEELAEYIKQDVFRTMENQRQAEIERENSIKGQVAEQIESIKKEDPSLDENKLFEHAIKYKFNDLTLAYQNMKDMGNIIKQVQKTTANNIAKRRDPVSVLPGANGQAPTPSSFSNAIDYLRSLKSG